MQNVSKSYDQTFMKFFGGHEMNRVCEVDMTGPVDYILVAIQITIQIQEFLTDLLMIFLESGGTGVAEERLIIFWWQSRSRIYILLLIFYFDSYRQPRIKHDLG